jgi:uncharacterized protein YggE
MSKRWVLVGAIVIALASGSSALAQTTQTPQTITATGTGQARVRPSDRHSNASIAAAYDKARHAAIGSALSEAQEYATDYARGVGMTLGSVISVSDAQSGPYVYGPGAFLGPFGPGKFCGKEPVPVFKKVNGKRKLVRFKKEHRCVVPAFADITLMVTYSAS